MSVSRSRLRKEKRQKRLDELLAQGSITKEDIAYANKIKRQIKQGVLPKYHVKRDEKGNLIKPKVKGYFFNLETKSVRPKEAGLALEGVSTYHSLVNPLIYKK